MTRRLVRIALAAVLLVATGELALLAARRTLRRSPGAPATEAPTPARIQALVMQNLVPAALGDAEPIDDRTETRRDDRGTWELRSLSWRLPAGSDPAETARDMRRLASELVPSAEVYRFEHPDLAQELRVYAGKRLACELLLRPTADASLPPPRDRPCEVALVVTGLGLAGRPATDLVDSPLPLTLAIRPFSPFALRNARDGMLHYKELLLDLGAGEELSPEVMEAVPGISGVALPAQPPELPVDALLDANLVLLASAGPATGPRLRSAREAGVVVVAADALLSGGDPEELLRLRRLARRSASLVVVTPLGSPAAPEVLRWLASGDGKDLRAVFLSEIARDPDRDRPPAAASAPSLTRP